MRDLWVPLCLLLSRVLSVSCRTVTFSSHGDLTNVGGKWMKQESAPVRAEQEVQLQQPPYDVSSFTMNVTIVDAHEGGLRTPSILDMDKNKSNHVNVISSWVLFHMPGNHTDALKQPALPLLVGGIRDAVADSLEVCRSSLGIVDMRAINIDVIDKIDLEEEASEKAEKSESTTLLEHAANLMRRMRVEDSSRSHVNVTQIKVVYEVRVFKEMRISDAEVGRRIDKFQIYSRFSDLNRMLGRSLAHVDGHAMENVMLDDVGYASRHHLTRPALGGSDLEDCAAEVALHDARQMHQFIVAVSLIMVALITCAGSTVFTIKHASSVPSRMNPLVDANANS